MSNLFVAELLFNSISCIGLCFILKYGSILSFLRKALTRFKFFKELFSCSLCLGFWSGLIIGLVINRDQLLISEYITFGANALMFAPYGAAICWVADMILDIIVKLGR